MGILKETIHKKGENSKGESSNSGSAAMVQDGSGDRDFGDVLTVCSASTAKTWIMVTGASYHMTCTHDLFSSFKEYNGTVKLGDDAVLCIKGSVIVQIKIHNGIVRKFNSWFVPGLKKNLISLSTLANNGLKYHGEGEWVKVSKGALKVSPDKFLIRRDVTFDESAMLGQSRDCESFTGTKDCGTDQKVEFDTPDRVVIKEEQQEKNNTNQPEQPEQSKPQVEPFEDEVDNTVIGVEDFIAVKKGKEMHQGELEAVASKYAENWIIAINEEMQSLKKNMTWDLVTLPKRVKLAGCKWVLKRKEGIPCVEPARFKARLVAKGFSQKEGIDYHEVFSPVVKHKTIRVLLAMVGAFNLELEQLDVKTAFLYGDLEEQIYMSQPEGFNNSRRDQVCLLKKSLYGSGRRAKNMVVINDLKALLKNEFEMKELGATKKILGIFVDQSNLVSTPLVAHFKIDRSTIPGKNKEGASNIYLVYDGKGHIDGLVGKETTKRYTKEPLAVRETPCQGGDCFLSDLDLAIYYLK
uniref:Retrovirus-related Pol polyprotein from transposon TNT 1-94 n=1 Tax=Tanacetum cinerariifolium TaxID=118510 RepID=A0A699HS41_TANCI|nr:retrovirus-related Pol polyprotein from transposon TNT 1-94 [Tanacetum cinerariifolium]